MRYFGLRHDTSEITASRYDAHAKVFGSILQGIASLQEKVINGNEFVNKAYEKMQVRCALFAAVPGIAFVATVAAAQMGANDHISSITNILTPGFFKVALPATPVLQAAGIVKAGLNYLKKGMVERTVAVAEKQIKHALFEVQRASEQTGIPVDTWNLRRLIEEHTRQKVAITPSGVTESIIRGDQVAKLTVDSTTRRRAAGLSLGS